MKKVKTKIKKFSEQLLSVGLIILLIAAGGYFHVAHAATLTALSDVMTRIQKSPATSSHDISFTLSGSNTFAAGESITVDFHEDESDFTVAGASSVIADFDFNDGTERTIVNVAVGAPSCSDGANNVAVGINDTTGVVTFQACGTYTPSSSGANINIEYGTAAGGTNRVTNPSAADTYVIDIDETTDDGAKIAIAILDSDQYTVSASVDPTLTFSLSGTSTDFGTLSSSSVTTSSPNIDLTISTNATGGYTITVQDEGSGSNPGLYSSVNAYTIGSADYSYNNTANLSSVAGYGIQGSVVAGSATIDARYNQTSTTVGGFERTATSFVTYNDPCDSDQLRITSKAKVTGSTPAGAYTDTVTVIATANF